MVVCFWCSTCRTNTNHKENDDGTWICRVCGYRVSRDNAEIFIAYASEKLLDNNRDFRIMQDEN